MGRRGSAGFGMHGSDGIGGLGGGNQIYHPAPLPSQEVDPFYYPAVVPGGKKRQGRKMDGKQVTFLTKLYR